jgi:hypothetical protein
VKTVEAEIRLRAKRRLKLPHIKTFVSHMNKDGIYIHRVGEHKTDLIFEDCVELNKQHLAYVATDDPAYVVRCFDDKIITICSGKEEQLHHVLRKLLGQDQTNKVSFEIVFDFGGVKNLHGSCHFVGLRHADWAESYTGRKYIVAVITIENSNLLLPDYESEESEE